MIWMEWNMSVRCKTTICVLNGCLQKGLGNKLKVNIQFHFVNTDVGLRASNNDFLFVHRLQFHFRHPSKHFGADFNTTIPEVLRECLHALLKESALLLVPVECLLYATVLLLVLKFESELADTHKIVGRSLYLCKFYYRIKHWTSVNSPMVDAPFVVMLVGRDGRFSERFFKPCRFWLL